MMLEVVFDKMVHQMEDELEGACRYVECTIVVRDDMPDVADMYVRMASVEMEHANTLHGAIKKFLERNDAPKELWAIWHWQNEKFMSKQADVRMRMDHARG